MVLVSGYLIFECFVVGLCIFLLSVDGGFWDFMCVLVWFGD